jgi:serine/threonine-protein kinase
MSASSPSIAIARRTSPPRSPRPLPRLGRYEALAELASGGAGTVYLARLQGIAGFERLFAIKALHKHLAKQPVVVEMLLKEARITSQIHHPHVVDTIELGATDDGDHFLVMAYVEGVSFDDLLEHPKLDAINRLRLGIPILLDAMSGLDAAHRAVDAATGEPLGIVHRDVSPANILIGMDGIGRVADFGIALARAHSAIPQPELLRGTPRYMAPEQVAGGPIDQRADVFALGAVLWEIITGESLFDSHTSVDHILSQVLRATIPPPSDRNSRIPGELDAVCLRALQRDAAERYQTVAELRDALAQVADGARLIATSSELIEELARLFGDRIDHRREDVRRAAGRKSGTRLRAITNTQLGSAAAPRQEAPETPEPLVTVTPEAPRDEPYSVPRKHWRRWAVITGALALLAIGWSALSSARPVEHARVELPAPAPRPLPLAPTVEIEPEPPALVAEPPQAAPAGKRVRVWKPLPLPRPTLTAPAETVTPAHDEQGALPLETNPYVLQR